MIKKQKDPSTILPFLLLPLPAGWLSLAIFVLQRKNTVVFPAPHVWHRRHVIDRTIMVVQDANSEPL
ncbi:MAG: hypothetical protein ACYDB0_00930 [Acidithiobacillus sp.]